MPPLAQIKRAIAARLRKLLAPRQGQTHQTLSGPHFTLASPAQTALPDHTSPNGAADDLAGLSWAERSLRKIESHLTRLQAGSSDTDGELTKLQSQFVGLEQRLVSLDATLRVLVSAETRALRHDLLQSRRILIEQLGQPAHSTQGVPEPDRSMTLSRSFERLQVLAPHAFAHWKRLLDVNASAYEGFPVDSCSVQGHPMAALFECFLRPYLKGRVLDIGCGPQHVPSYLSSVPTRQIAGVDPLAPATPHPFVFAQGVAEYLPWPDATFDVVTVATSLDHVLLLDRALKEMRRVLKPDGRLVLWMGFIRGSLRYDPYREDIEPVDPYHLFHFDEAWFMDVVANEFVVDECLSINREYPGYCAFLALRPRSPDCNAP